MTLPELLPITTLDEAMDEIKRLRQEIVERNSRIAALESDDTPEAATTPAVAKPLSKKEIKRRNTRTYRWTEAASDAVAALEILNELKSEFEEWRDNLPENLQQSALGEKLEAICDLDIDTALETAGEAEGLDLPMGFGRD